jgi:hypothetical protein
MGGIAAGFAILFAVAAVIQLFDRIPVRCAKCGSEAWQGSFPASFFANELAGKPQVGAWICGKCCEEWAERRVQEWVAGKEWVRLFDDSLPLVPPMTLSQEGGWEDLRKQLRREEEAFEVIRKRFRSRAHAAVTVAGAAALDGALEWLERRGRDDFALKVVTKWADQAAVPRLCALATKAFHAEARVALISTIRRMPDARAIDALLRCARPEESCDWPSMAGGSGASSAARIGTSRPGDGKLRDVAIECLTEWREAGVDGVPIEELTQLSARRRAERQAENLEKQAENLDRWKRSGDAERWIVEHRGDWSEEDWQTLLATLERGQFCPLDPTAVGLHLETLKKHYLNAASAGDDYMSSHLGALCSAYAANNRQLIETMEPLALFIGHRLHARGGRSEMRRFFDQCGERPGRRTLEMHWNGIGEWRG